MSFTDYERSYLAGQPLGRLATLAPDGSPQTRPVGFFFNDELGTVDIGGHNLGRSQKFHNIQLDGRVSFVVDDLASIDPWAPRGIEIRGEAEAIVDAEPPVPASRTSSSGSVHTACSPGASTATHSPRLSHAISNRTESIPPIPQDLADGLPDAVAATIPECGGHRPRTVQRRSSLERPGISIDRHPCG